MNAVANTPSSAEQDTLSAFVTVPATRLSDGHVEPAFQVGRYLCSKDASGAAVIDATLVPWVNINYADARAACNAAGFNLITERQALALAINIAGVDANWTGGSVGEGLLRQGFRNSTSRIVHGRVVYLRAQPGRFVPVDADEQRWFVLSNGERVCDAAGNAYTWVFDNVQGDEQGLVARAFSADSPSITSVPYPLRECGMGWQGADRDGTGRALVRGGSFRSWKSSGVFLFSHGRPGLEDEIVGFRCTQPSTVL